METEVIAQVPNTFEGLFWGYSAFWAMIAMYLIRLSFLVRAIKRESRRD